MRGAACSDGRAASTSGKQPQKVSIFLPHLVIRWTLRDDDVLEVDEPASPYSCNNYIITVSGSGGLFVCPAR